MVMNRSACVLFIKRTIGIVLSASLTMTAGVSLADEREATAKPPVDPPFKPRTFDKQIADKLGIGRVAYLLAVDVNGKVMPFVPDDPKASFRVIDPTREKLTMDLFEIAPLTIVAGKRNPFCVIFVGGGARKLWMESCP